MDKSKNDEKTTTFSPAFKMQTRNNKDDEVDRSAFSAIQSLDSLNDQIVQYIFTPRDVTLDLDRELSSHEQETLRSSMLLIRRLLMDAQSKFRKMVEDNKQLAARIDGSIHAANQEVNALRAELADTNKRLTQISNGSPKSAKENLLPLAFQGNDCNPTNLVFGALCYRELGSAEMLNSADQYPIKNPNQMMIKSNITTTQFSDLSEQNLKLKLQVSNLCQELEELQKAQAAKSHLQQQTSFGEMKLEVIQTKRDLSRAKEALQALKADRKRLKAEKLELLNQLKQLYGTLENKETELREFIWKYERHMAENEENIKKMASEKEDVEREKWEIIKRAREAAERSVILQSKLDSKEKLVQRMQSDLNETRASVTSDVFEKLTNSTNERQSIDEFPSLETNGTEKSTNEKNSKVPNNNPASTNEGESKSESTLMNFLSSSQEILDNEIKQQKKKKSFGSLTKIFSKSRNRRSMALTSESELEDSNSCTLPRLSLLSPENHQEKLELVEQLKKIPMSEWKANQVLAWLELHLAMPFYGQMCCDNIKSGKVLLGLSDSELSSALGITNPIHRRKLRLAIDEHRDFIEIKYPKASELDHNWVCQTWLNDIGLPQYKKTFESQLVDGRMLNTISKKDMEKHFGIHRKFHQASFLHAVELLKTVNFDKEVLRKRREKCADQNVDPIVWNSERLIKWVKSIDLKEYADNLKESGVHGALIVLEPLFNADTLATALGIPPSKSYVRRHLISELDALIKPARANMDVRIISKKKTNGGSLGRSFPRSFRTNNDDFTPKSRMSIRGSIGKAFGRRNLRPVFDSKDSSDADTPTHTKQNRLEPVTTPPPPSCDLDFSSTTV